MKWFGDPWPSAELRAPICENDDDRIPIPVGEKCYLCQEIIVEGDRGEQLSGSIIMGSDGKPAPGPIPYQHVECGLRNVTGNHLHVRGMCTHVGSCNEMSSLTYHEEALEVWRLIYAMGVIRE